MFFSFPIIGISKFSNSHFYLSKKILLPLRHFVKMACKKTHRGDFDRWFWGGGCWVKTYLVCELTSPRRLFLQSNLFQETSELCYAEDFATCSNTLGSTLHSTTITCCSNTSTWTQRWLEKKTRGVFCFKCNPQIHLFQESSVEQGQSINCTRTWGEHLLPRDWRSV